MRGKELIKLLKAVNLLARPRGVTINELSSELSLVRRSIYNLIDMLEALNFPVYSENTDLGREKTWKLEDSYIKKLPNISVPDLALTYKDIVSLFILWGESGFYKGTEIEQNIKETLNKIGMSVPEDLSDQLTKIKSLFIPTAKLSKDYSGKEELIHDLTDAMVQQRVCIVTYHSFSSDQTKEYPIHPLYFFHNKGGFYLFANIPKYEEIRTLAVERVLKVKITEERFEYPNDFDPEKKLDSAFDIIYDEPVDLKVWFSKEQAKYIKERTWSRNQRIIENNDGSLILSLQTSGWWNIKHWVLSFGPEAKLLKPEEMKDEIIRDLKKNLKNYTP